jgi:hypothetical protein
MEEMHGSILCIISSNVLLSYTYLATYDPYAGIIM